MVLNTDEMRLYMRERRKRIQKELRASLGSKCARCTATEELEFDHVDPETKKFQLSGRGLDKPRAEVEEELAKCQLLCRSCHIEKTTGERPSHRGDPNYATHGTVAGYRYYGCRCEPCKAARSRSRRTRGLGTH